MPCCIRAELYLGTCSLEVDDDTRYQLLSGAFANAVGAQLVRAVDRRITARPVLIAGGLHRPTASIPAHGAAAAAKQKTQQRRLRMPP